MVSKTTLKNNFTAAVKKVTILFSDNRGGHDIFDYFTANERNKGSKFTNEFTKKYCEFYQILIFLQTKPRDFKYAKIKNTNKYLPSKLKKLYGFN